MKISAYSFFKSLSIFALLLSIQGCSLTKVPFTDPQCNIQAYIDQSVVNYLSRRFDKGSTPRIAIIPFDVPVNFSPEMNPELRFGFKLAEMFQRNLLQKNERIIAEIFNRSEWPGKRLDFSTGNYIALRQARDAGYDFILIGFMDTILDAQILSLDTKLIDTDSNTTVWFGRSEISSPARPTHRTLNFLSRGIYPLREDQFFFTERSEKLVSCTVDRIINLPQ